VLRFSSHEARSSRRRSLAALRLTCVAALAVAQLASCSPPRAGRVSDSSAARPTPSAATSHPAWIDRSVGYGVLPPLFGPAGLRDVTRSLDSLHDLGVNILWLSPIFAAPAGDFGYAVIDYLRVRSDYGTEADLAALVREAHARDIRVILDLPANHTSIQHPWYVDATARGRESAYYDYYDRGADGGVTHYFDWTHLPNLNYENAALATFMVEASRHWIVQFSIDGYRIDAAWGIRQRTPEFWPRFAADMRAASADVFLLAEASARDDFYVRHGFDAAYDWTSELGVHAWKGVFDEPSNIPKRLHAAVLETQEHTPEPQHTWRFLNNNDTAERFITRHAEGMTRVATAALLTLPGIPCLYSFDEVGAEYLPYSSLQPITTSAPELRDFHRRWIHWRRSRAALSGRGFTAVHVGEAGRAAPDVYAYLRHEASETLLVVLSFSATPSELTLQLPAARWGKSRARDLHGGPDIPVEGGQLKLTLGPWDARILEPR
jgi:cyclomaltodextrinase